MKKGKEFFTTFLTCLVAIVSFSISSCGTNLSSLPNQMDLSIGHDWKSDISIGIESNKTFDKSKITAKNISTVSIPLVAIMISLNISP